MALEDRNLLFEFLDNQVVVSLDAKWLLSWRFHLPVE